MTTKPHAVVRIASWALAVASLVAPLPGAIVAAHADGGPDGPRCSNRTLKGAWGIRFQGQKVDGTLIASVARIVFDGNGVFTTSEIGRFNGNPFARTFTGPYAVNADCTGFLDFSSNLTTPSHEVLGNFVIVEQGREIYFLDNEDGWAAIGVGKRM